MSKDLEKYINGENNTAYSLFGSFKVNDGGLFRIYAPRAKEVILKVNDKAYPMNKCDFRGEYEIRVNDIREFDTYSYNILTNDDIWINKDDPFARLTQKDKCVFVGNDEYKFTDEKWANKDKSKIVFNACLLNKEIDIDQQREIVNYLKKYKFTYLILKPYDDKHLFKVNSMFVNISTLKNFINNLHESNIGVIFDFDCECFRDYEKGLNDFDGSSLYNLQKDKYKEINTIYFDYSKKHTKSFVNSFVNYYLEEFHGDGLYLNENEFTKELEKIYKDKLVIYKGNENKKDTASDKYLLDIIDNYNKGFDYHKFVNFYKELKQGTYLLYDYEKCLNLIKDSKEHEKDISLILLTLTYISNHYCISAYCLDKVYLKALDKLVDVYDSSKSLHNSNTMELLYNGKKHNYFAYQFSYRNEYIILFLNFSDTKDDDFDLGMPYYGYYKLILDTINSKINDNLIFTRNKKIHNKNIAIKMPIEGYQALVYKRMRDI